MMGTDSVAAAVVVGLFVLRFGVPVVVVAGVIYALRHWERRRWRTAYHRAEKAGSEQVNGWLKPLQTLKEPCYLLSSCTDEVLAKCPARKDVRVPCWVMRRQAEGRLPVKCLGCERYLQTQALEAVV